MDDLAPGQEPDQPDQKSDPANDQQADTQIDAARLHHAATGSSRRKKARTVGCVLVSRSTLGFARMSGRPLNSVRAVPLPCFAILG
jgi:hypothetical protein